MSCNFYYFSHFYTLTKMKSKSVDVQKSAQNMHNKNIQTFYIIVEMYENVQKLHTK